jgi:hypothetical protein
MHRNGDLAGTVRLIKYRRTMRVDLRIRAAPR